MRRTRIDDAATLEIALRWAPYGGVPTSEIWVTFGVSPGPFYTTLARILNSVVARELSVEQRQLLERLVMRHLRASISG